MTLPTYPIKSRDWLILLLVLFVAALLRLGEPGAVEFFHDEAMLSMLAQEMADGLTFPLVGIVSSVGVPNPPVTVYVMALPYLFTDNPLIATMYVAALNVIGVGVLWFIARRYFGRTVALVAGLTYAVSPWAVLYSRKIWAQDFHTPFVLVAVALGLLGFGEGRRWAQVACLPVLIFALQIHFAAWALLPLYAVLLWMGWRGKTLNRGALLASVGLTALVLLPYAVGLATTLSDDPDRLSTVVSRTEVASGLALTGDPLRFTAMLGTGLGLETWVAPLAQSELLTAVPTLPLLWALVGGLAVVGGVYLWVAFALTPDPSPTSDRAMRDAEGRGENTSTANDNQAHRTSRGGVALLLTVWVVVPLAVFTLGWTTVYPHYFVGVLPALALLTGVGVDALARLLPGKPVSRVMVLAGLAAILLTQGLWWRGLTRYVTETEIALGPGTSGYTLPIADLLRIQDAIGDANDVIIVSDDQDPLFDAEAARWPVMLRDRVDCVRTVPLDGLRVHAERSLATIVMPGNLGFTPTRDFYIGGESQRIPTRDGEAVVSYYNRYPVLVVDWIDLDPVTFANGPMLTGHAIRSRTVYLRWSLPESPSRLLLDRDHNYQYFVHLLDADGQRLFQIDAPYWQGRHWCAGDTLITSEVAETMDIIRATTTLRVGFYRLTDDGDPAPVDVLDVAGNPAGNWFDIPLGD